MHEDFKALTHRLNLVYKDGKGSEMELTFNITPGGPGRIVQATWNGQDLKAHLGVELRLSDEGFELHTTTRMSYDDDDITLMAGVLATMQVIKADVLADVNNIENVFIGYRYK